MLAQKKALRTVHTSPSNGANGVEIVRGYVAGVPGHTQWTSTGLKFGYSSRIHYADAVPARPDLTKACRSR
ncbi:MAG TPA: hypothetical protein VFI49_13815, partial [Rudaea sp.]|nr:hypothetical protein [Rudaea sp.]